LEGEIGLGSGCGDVNFLARGLETEHADFDVPLAGGHAVHSERTILIRHGEQDPIALRGLHRGAGHGLPVRFYDSSLRESRLGKNRRETHAGQKEISHC
jgi:hypothetical protein